MATKPNTRLDARLFCVARQGPIVVHDLAERLERCQPKVRQGKWNTQDDAVDPATQQHLVEALAKIAEHMIAVDALSMASVDRCSRAADQHRPRNQRLNVAFGGQELLPLRYAG